MKKIAYNIDAKNAFLGFESLNEIEMLAVRGGKKVKPKSRPKDIMDIEEESEQ